MMDIQAQQDSNLFKTLPTEAEILLDLLEK